MADSLLMSILRDDWSDFIPRTFHRGPCKKPVTKQYKVSICTTCMNRTDDLKQTYIQNIEDNKHYPGIEFVLLNYNSDKDDMDKWAKKNLKGYIKKGLVNYYHTTEPKYYSMTHSRNVAFKLAEGDIVNNVDADHFTSCAHGHPIKYQESPPNMCFAEQINLLANQYHEKSIFIKSKQKNRGRLGFFKEEFLWIGGYDEDIEGYGHDDCDLLDRALLADFTIFFFGGAFFSHTEDHRRHPTCNYKNRDWRYTQRKNTLISILNLKYNKIQANEDKHWGKAKLLKNWTDVVEI
jgi:hypothetical protein